MKPVSLSEIAYLFRLLRPSTAEEKLSLKQCEMLLHLEDILHHQVMSIQPGVFVPVAP